jgi:hypothetical protein
MSERAFGVTIRVNWTSSPQIGGIVDAAWEADALPAPEPKGNWWGPWIALAGKPATEGESVYSRGRKELWLWVPFPVEGLTARYLLMILREFAFPPQSGSGATGPGSVYPDFQLPSSKNTIDITWTVA